MDVVSKVTGTLRRVIDGQPLETRLKAGEVVSLPDRIAKELLAKGKVELQTKAEAKVEPKKAEPKPEPKKEKQFIGRFDEEDFNVLR